MRFGGYSGNTKRILTSIYVFSFFYEGEKPHEAFFIRQATRFGYDLDEYLEALKRVRVFKREKVEDILDYDNALATFLMDLAEKSLSKKIADYELRKTQNYLSNVINSMPSVKSKGRGTGLGVSVSYFIITEGHGGEMSVHAADGGGTRFLIRLPTAGKKKVF
jgi:hypothetical protein